LKNIQTSHFTEVRGVGSELFHEDDRTDRQTWRS